MIAADHEFADDPFLQGFTPKRTTAKGLGEVITYMSEEICKDIYDEDLVYLLTTKQTSRYVCSKESREQRSTY